MLVECFVQNTVKNSNSIMLNLLFKLVGRQQNHLKFAVLHEL